MTSQRVLVLETERRQGIVAVRNLGRHGLRVTAASDRHVNPGGLSRYAARRLRYPDPRTDESGFLDAVEAELRARDYDAVVPMTDVTVPTVVEHRDRFEPDVEVPYPPKGILDVGFDKARTIDAAREAGVPVPRTLARDELDLDEVEAELDYPVVVKPQRAAGRSGVSVCETAEKLESTFERTREQFGPLLVQEFVPNGGEAGVYTIYDWSSELAGITVQRRLRSNPPEGGPSTLRETYEDPELVEYADALLSEIGWQGVAMVEFRRDADSGVPKLMEINPRFWGSLALSVAAGVEFPYLLYQLAVDGDCDRTLSYRKGVQARRAFGELAHVLNRPDPGVAVREILEPAPGPRSFDILSASDPGPAVGFLARTGYQFVDRRVK
ncbi:carboxylate--amine ligase [Halegenticoccus soli]|uniref:carboxylate--amine ligase n=1 Tax=Halegenticoccus soli TaxID=1985678 RepID=UPI000C6CFB32|nr:ATP-grasp domain-containing protein [Halegenticoccus soli]